MKQITTGRHAKRDTAQLLKPFAKQITTIILFLALCSLLSISGCWLAKENTDDMVDELSIEEMDALIEEAGNEVVEVNEELEADVNILKEIVADGNATAESCETIADPDIKESCEQKFIYETAVANGDEDMCAELLNEYDQEKCLENL